MSWLQTLSLLPPPDSRPTRVVEQEILDELEFHIEMRTLDNQSVGMSADDARRDALNRFGDFERIRKKCRRTQLGERIMLQRVQAVLTLILLGAVIFMGVELYQGQRANAAATAIMIQRLEQLAEKPAAIPAAATEATLTWMTKAEKPAANPDDAAPMVVQTTPRAGEGDVDPALTEIRVMYNKNMMDGNWSWCYDPDQLKTTGRPRYEADGKTCVLPVKLEPGKTYSISLNSESFHNFKDAAGRSAIPYVLYFHTRQ